MKNKSSLYLALLSATVVIPSQAKAEEHKLFDFSANVGIVSEYSFRGIAQSNESLAVQGGFDLSHDTGFYAGIWGSNIDFNSDDDADLELDLYAGYSGSFSDVSYDVGVIYYSYPGADSGLNYDFWEGSLAFGYDFGLLSASASFNYSPEFFGESGDAQYYGASVDVPLPYDVTLSGHLGYQAIDDNAAFGVPDYMDWSVGLGYNFKGFDFALTYVDTDLHEPSECADGCSERIILSVSRSF